MSTTPFTTDRAYTSGAKLRHDPRGDRMRRFMSLMKTTPPLRILLLETDTSVQGALDEFLRGRGHNVVSLQSGVMAIRRIREDVEIFDLVLLNLALPDAMEVLYVARQRSSGTQVVTMPGFAGLDAAIESMLQGAFDYVIKPFKFTQVAIVLNKVIERKKLVEENAKLSERVQSLYNRLDQLKDNRERLEKFARDLFEKLDYHTEMLEECVSRLRKEDV
jgi:two-component system NtrC family response regulator